MPGFRITAPYFGEGEFAEFVESARNDPLREPTEFEKAILMGLQSKPVYQGTVEPEGVARRRRRNKQARKSRRINRLAAKR